MKNSKLSYAIIVLVFLLCFVSIYFSLQTISLKIGGTNNDRDNDTTDNNGDINNIVPSTNDMENINEFVDYVKMYDTNNRSDYMNQYNSYYINNGVLNGYNYNTTKGEFVNNLNHSFGVEKGIYNGKIFIKNDDSIYFSISNGQKCYVKVLENEEIEIYNVSEKDKCHRAYVLSEELSVDLFIYNFDTGVVYNEGEISASSLLISINTNLLDVDAATYKWYRNGVLIENNSSSSLLLESDEDATYYVEMFSFDGKTAKSEGTTIKIKK